MVVKVTAANYEPLKAFVGWVFEYTGALPPNLPPEAHPIAVLEKFELESPATARRSLQMGLGDVFEITDRLGPDELTTIDAALRATNLPTLSEVRIDFSKKINRIMAKGCVRSEAEYHALRNVADGMNDNERAKDWDILGAYEAKVPKS